VGRHNEEEQQQQQVGRGGSHGNNYRLSTSNH